MQNRYGSLVGPWKLRLINERARRLGVQRRYLEDIQQNVMLDLLAERPLLR